MTASPANPSPAERLVIVITDARHGRIDEELEVFRPFHAELRVADCRDSADVALACAEADAVLLDQAPMDAAAIAGLRKCRVISRYGIGMDNVDAEATEARGIAVRNVPGYCDEEAAEHALSLMLALARNTVSRDLGVRDGAWNLPQPQYAVAGSTVGVAGFGGSGKALSRMVLGLRPAELLVWSPHLTPERLEAELGALSRALGVRVAPAGFHELLERSDFLSAHLKLVPETRKLFGAEAFARCKRGAFFINVARGGLVDEAALARALDAGILAGAGLDVLEHEPPLPGNPLTGRSDVVLSDHCAYRSTRSIAELKRRCAENAARVLGLIP